jgi:hypothetical protein
MSASAPLVDSRFGPGTALYIKTRADIPADALWAALKDFGPDRPTLWPFIHPPLYEVYEVGERHAEVKEGTRMGPGITVWARERYEWDDTTREMRSTVIESGMFKPGGTARLKVTPDSDGCFLEEWYERERTGFSGKLMNRLAPRVFPKMIPKGRAQTFAKIAERQR